MERWTLYIGIGAGICTAIAALPQLIKILKTKKADDLSFAMIAILITGLGLWVVYGFMKKDLPVIITNAFSFLVNLLIIVFGLFYRKRL